MYALTVALLAAVAVIVSAAPAPQQQDALVGDLQSDYWTACGKLLSINNIATPPTSTLDIGKITTNGGLWFLAAYNKPWMNTASGVDAGTLTCANWTIETDTTKNAAIMHLNTSPPPKTATAVYTLANLGTPQVQVLQSTGANTISGLSFLQLDDNNAALVGCSWTAAVAPATTGTASYFWNVLTRNQTGTADTNAMQKLAAQITAVPGTIDMSSAQTQSNAQCTAPSGATQITAMSGLVLAVIALLASHLL